MDTDVNSIPEHAIYFAQHEPPAITRSLESLNLNKPHFAFIATAAPEQDVPKAGEEMNPLAAIYIPFRLLQEANAKFGVTMSRDDFYKNVTGLHDGFVKAGMKRGDCINGKFAYAVEKGGDTLGALIATATVCRFASAAGNDQQDVFLIPDRTKNFSIEFQARQQPAQPEDSGRGRTIPRIPTPFTPAVRANQWT